MNIPSYESKMSVFSSTPNERYRDHLQEQINSSWEETTTIFTVEEETPFGTFNFEELEVKLNHALDKSTNIKQGDDFREVIFKDINWTVQKGLYYRFNDNYWIAQNTDEYNLISKNIMIRRCNNFIRFKDPIDGHLIEYPCIIEYDASSPTPKVDNDIITPNNHVDIIVQGNEETIKLLNRNLRIIFNQDVFKLTGYNKYMNDSATSNNTSLMYLDGYLTTRLPEDDFINGIAYNTKDDYTIQINQGSFSQVSGYSTTLTTTTTRSGEIIDGAITWLSSNEDAVTVDANGLVQLAGEPNTSSEITARLGQNTNVESTITISVVEILDEEIKLIISPIFDVISQGKTIPFNANVYIDDVLQNDIVSIMPSGPPTECYDLVDNGNNSFELSCIKLSSIPLILTFFYRGQTLTRAIRLKSMF